MDPKGKFDARYLAFLETISQLRPRLHRYCSRMTGSVMDGEDIVQDVLFEVYRKLDQYDDSRPLVPWIFRIAHNRCIDFLRRKGVRDEAEAAFAEPDCIVSVDPPLFGIARAVEHLVLNLPPKERACILLKDIFDYTLEEIAELVSSTVGGVKAALNRGRSKLAAMPEPVRVAHVANPERSRILRLYVDRFNRRDWDGLRELISADAQLCVMDRFAGLFRESPYLSNYERMAPWRLSIAEVDGELAVIVFRQHQQGWMPDSVARLQISDGYIERIVDYVHCPWVLPAATSVIVDSQS